MKTPHIVIINDEEKDLDTTLFQNLIQKLVNTLATLREDSEMALTEEWDRGDEGFHAQIDLIDELLDEAAAAGFRPDREAVVIMTSEVYGSEEFAYDSFKEAQAGMERLKQAAANRHDGIERTFSIKHRA